MDTKIAGAEIAIVINGLDPSEKKELMKALVKNLDKNSKLILENAMEVII